MAALDKQSSNGMRSVSERYANTQGIARAKMQDRVAKIVLCAIAGVLLVVVGWLVLHVLAAGASKLIDIKFLAGASKTFGEGGGIGAQLFNTWYLLFVTLICSVPLSLGAAIYVTQYAKEGRMTRLFTTSIEVLASLPSIIVGLFGFLAFVLYAGWGFSILSGAITLTFFNLPILVRVMVQALQSVPRAQRDAALALGLTRWEATTQVLLPEALPALVTGVILSAGRVLGEAATLMYTAGQSTPALNFANFNPLSPSSPWNIMRPAETLAVHIWKINSESVIPDVAIISAGTAAVLLVCILTFNVLARFISSRFHKKVTAL